MYFAYGETATAYLKSRDRRLGAAIDRIGHINREVDTDLFASVVRHIIGQQISTAAQVTIWRRLTEKFETVTAAALCRCSRDELQALGMTFRKADYIRDFARQVNVGEFLIAHLPDLPDAEIIKELSALKGIGVWTAEMIMTFCLQRPDIVSFGDLAILRGMRMLYHHRHIDRNLFDKYRRRYSPYGSVASLYLWAIAGGALPEMRDYAPKKEGMKK